VLREYAWPDVQSHGPSSPPLGAGIAAEYPAARHSVPQVRLRERGLFIATLPYAEADPITLIGAAQAGGYDAIGLRIVPPFPTDHVFPVIGDRNLIRSIKRRLSETGVRVLDVEAIWLTAESDVATLEPALDTAVEVGAGYVIVVGNDPDRGRLAGNLSRPCAAASLRGVRVMFEFIPYSHIRSLAQAVALLADVGAANAGVLVDALHLSSCCCSASASCCRTGSRSVPGSSWLFRQTRWGPARSS
jgi:hypothetical protein